MPLADLCNAASTGITSSCLGSPLADSASIVRRLDEIGRLVDALLASWEEDAANLTPRKWHRFEFDRPLALTPLDGPVFRPCGEPRRVQGIDISAGGLSFAHAAPLACRYAAVTLRFPDGGAQSVVTLLKWCRFTRAGSYQSGGQFLQPIRLPGEDRLDPAVLVRA